VWNARGDTLYINNELECTGAAAYKRRLSGA
jgi:hypothetical protein